VPVHEIIPSGRGYALESVGFYGSFSMRKLDRASRIFDVSMTRFANRSRWLRRRCAPRSQKGTRLGDGLKPRRLFAARFCRFPPKRGRAKPAPGLEIRCRSAAPEAQRRMAGSQFLAASFSSACFAMASFLSAASLSAAGLPLPSVTASRMFRDPREITLGGGFPVIRHIEAKGLGKLRSVP
jgi:hypothetical protein